MIGFRYFRRRAPRLSILAMLAATAWSGNRLRRISPDDLPPALSILFPLFENDINGIERRTQARLSEGLRDHLIFYVLQSRRFTKEARIEPALSARTYIEAGNLIPEPVVRRVGDFIHAPQNLDSRIQLFRAALHPDKSLLLGEYARVMRFLYAKEFSGAQVAGLYQQRGLSTDTQVEANFAVWNALAVLKANQPNLSLSKILVVGPGLDLAPRTDFFDDLPPQSYQPFAIADALLGLKLARPEDVRVHCVDVNPSVVEAIHSTRTLRLAPHQMDGDYQLYFRALGTNIGERIGDDIRIQPRIRRAVTAEQMNILTERIDGAKFDAIIATNILLYFDHQELALALTNMRQMLAEGGFLITNELRPEVESDAQALGLTPVQGRTIKMGGSATNPLYDAFVIFKR